MAHKITALEINGRSISAQYENGQRELWFNVPPGYENAAAATNGLLDVGEDISRRNVTSKIGASIVAAMQKRRNKENLTCTKLEEDRIITYVAQRQKG